jgi:putative protease
MDIIKGFLVRNIEAVEFVKKHIDKEAHIVADSNMYIMNVEAIAGLCEYGINRCTYSLELTKDEIVRLNQAMNKNGLQAETEMIIYTTPVAMLSAGCIKKTKGMCNKKEELLKLKDKYNETYYVKTICEHCFNIIYNSKKINIIKDADMIANSYRVELLSESKEEVYNILDSIFDKGNMISDFKGHYYKETM